MKKTSLNIAWFFCLVIFCSIFHYNFSYSADNSVYSSVKDKASKIKGPGLETMKKFLRTSKGLEKEITQIVKKIEDECCHKKFQKKEELISLKTDLQDCLSRKCYKINLKKLKGKQDRYLIVDTLNRSKKLLSENLEKK